MEVKEAIERIEDHSKIHFTKEYPRAMKITEALDMAIKALKKQIPKKPIIWHGECYCYSPMLNPDDWGYECPCCGNQEIDYPEHHCTCGQALDWDDI